MRLQKLTQVNLDPVLLPSFWGQLRELAHPELQSTTAIVRNFALVSLKSNNK